MLKTEFADEVDDEFLSQVCAVGDAGDECGARNSNVTKRESVALGANE